MSEPRYIMEPHRHQQGCMCWQCITVGQFWQHPEVMVPRWRWLAHRWLRMHLGRRVIWCDLFGHEVNEDLLIWKVPPDYPEQVLRTVCVNCFRRVEDPERVIKSYDDESAAQRRRDIHE